MKSEKFNPEAEQVRFRARVKSWLLKSIASLFILFALSVLLTQVSVQSLAAPDVIFSDDFERTGTVIDNGWTVTEPIVGNPRLSTAAVAKALGSKGVLFEGTTETTQASIERIIDTSGYSNVELSYYRGVEGLDEGDSFVVEHEAPAGNAPTSLETIAGVSGSEDDQTPTQVNFPLPSNASLLIRFRLDANAAADKAGVDEIVVTGDLIGEPTPTGELTPTLTPTPTVTPTPTEIEPTPTLTPAPTPAPGEAPSFWSWFRWYMNQVFERQRELFRLIWQRPVDEVVEAQ